MQCSERISDMPRILIAEDNPVTLQFFLATVEREGFECHAAVNGTEAVDLAERYEYDLLLIDSQMPVLDGAETLKKIRSGYGPSKRARAIATTAGDKLMQDALSLAGFEQVILKPVSASTLREILRSSTLDAPDGRAATSAALSDEILSPSDFAEDQAIVSALRHLLAAELATLSSELQTMALEGDIGALKGRLHRLRASAGFCGTPRLLNAVIRVSEAISSTASWPSHEIEHLVRCADETRAACA
jgi:CheY-like chemotaxis protein